MGEPTNPPDLLPADSLMESARVDVRWLASPSSAMRSCSSCRSLRNTMSLTSSALPVRIQIHTASTTLQARHYVITINQISHLNGLTFSSWPWPAQRLMKQACLLSSLPLLRSISSSIPHKAHWSTWMQGRSERSLERMCLEREERKNIIIRTLKYLEANPQHSSCMCITSCL